MCVCVNINIYNIYIYIYMSVCVKKSNSSTSSTHPSAIGPCRVFWTSKCGRWPQRRRRRRRRRQRQRRRGGSFNKKYWTIGEDIGIKYDLIYGDVWTWGIHGYISIYPNFISFWDHFSLFYIYIDYVKRKMMMNQRTEWVHHFRQIRIF